VKQGNKSLPLINNNCYYTASTKMKQKQNKQETYLKWESPKQTLAFAVISAKNLSVINYE